MGQKEAGKIKMKEEKQKMEEQMEVEVPVADIEAAEEEVEKKAVKEEKLASPDELTFSSAERLYHVRGVESAGKGGSTLRVRIKLSSGEARAIDAVDH